MKKSSSLVLFAHRTGKRLQAQTRSGPVYLAAFFLPFIIIGLAWAISGVWPFGVNMILAHDQWHQYYPFFLVLQEKLQTGGSLLYSWRIGMGTNFLSLAAYYLASPLNLLSVILPQSLALPYYTLTVLVKISCAGLFFTVFLSHTFQRKDFTLPFFSTLYALCSFVMGYYWNAIWLDTFALLPLVVLGALRLFTQGRFCLYTLTLALSIFCSYYIGLFTCVFVVLLFITYTICCWDGFLPFLRRSGQMLLFSLLAGGMTAILTLPAYMGLQSTSSAVNQFPESFAINISSPNTILGVFDALRQVISNAAAGLRPTSMEGLPNIYCGVVMVVLAVLYCANNKISLREKLCCCGMLLFFALSFIIRQLDYLWHGGHFTNMLPYRFSFLFSFVVLFMAFRLFTKLDQLRWPHVVTAIPVLIVYLYCVFTQQRLRSALLTTLIVLAAIVALFLFTKGKLRKTILVLGLCACMLAEGILSGVMGIRQVSFTNGSDYPRSSEDVQLLLSQMEAREAGNTDLYRTEVTLQQSLNDDALNGYNGVSVFSSASNCNVSTFLRSIGVAAGPTANRYVYQQADPFTNMLLGIKYLLDREGLAVDPTHFTQVGSSGDVLLLENDDYLPMGFMVGADTVNYDITSFTSGSTCFDHLNDLHTRMTGDNRALFTTQSLTSATAEGEASLEKYGISGYALSAEGATGEAEGVFTYTAQSECQLCLYLFASDAQNVTVYINDEQQFETSANYGYLRYIGQLAVGDTVAVHIAPKTGKTSYLKVCPAIWQEQVFDDMYAQLSTQTMTATEVTDTSISGNIVVKEDGLFYISVPNDPGWSAIVDGQEVEITPVGDAFIAFPLTTGAHTITLRYITPGLSLGWKVTAACLLVFLALALWSKLRRKPTPPPEPDPEPPTPSWIPKTTMPRLDPESPDWVPSADPPENQE